MQRVAHICFSLAGRGGECGELGGAVEKVSFCVSGVLPPCFFFVFLGFFSWFFSLFPVFFSLFLRTPYSYLVLFF
jgi:hypothetical protein